MKTKMIGSWQCNYLNAESIIIFNQTDNELFAYTYYLETNMLPIKQNLILQDNKYLVRDSQMGEYFIIDNAGILLIYDREGLVAKALNVTPGTSPYDKSYPYPEITFTEIIGIDYRYIVGMTSRVAPKLLYSDSDEMLVHCPDTGMYLIVDKATKKILKYSYGLHNVKASDLNYIICAN